MYEPDLPAIKPFQPFDTVVDGPFAIVRDPATVITGIQTLTDAVAEFARLAVPAHHCRVAHIINDHGVCVLGYMRRDEDSPVEWFGLQQGFDLLYEQPYVEQLEIVLAEEQARRAARG